MHQKSSKLCIADNTKNKIKTFKQHIFIDLIRNIVIQNWFLTLVITKKNSRRIKCNLSLNNIFILRRLSTRTKRYEIASVPKPPNCVHQIAFFFFNCSVIVYFSNFPDINAIRRKNCVPSALNYVFDYYKKEYHSFLQPQQMPQKKKKKDV